MFFIIEKSEETTFEFSQNAVKVVWFWLRIKMETQKITNLLGDANNESSKFATRKWYVINDQNNKDYGEGNGMLSIIKITQTIVKEMKIVQPLNWKPKSLNQILVIIQMHIFL